MRKPRYNNSISLNKQIMNTHSARELHAIVRTKGAGFDFFNISSAIARVPKLVGLTGGVQVSEVFEVACVVWSQWGFCMHLMWATCAGAAAWLCRSHARAAFISHASSCCLVLGTYFAAPAFSCNPPLPPPHQSQSDSAAKALVDDLATLMASNINTFDARGLANSAWAFGKLKYAPNQKLPQLIAAAAITKMDAFSAQNLSNLLWSFVYLHHRDEALMAAVAKQVRSMNGVWACIMWLQVTPPKQGTGFIQGKAAGLLLWGVNQQFG
jgi:hypothetical protein